MINSFYSFVTPVRNQENEIYDNIFKLIKKIKKNSFIKIWEIVIIDDGSNDKTFKKLIDLKKKEKRIKIFKNSRNKGKGYSIKRGVSNINVKSDRVILIDSDIPYFNELNFFLKKLQNNDLVIINRKDRRSKFIIKDNNIYSYLRFFIGNSMNLLFRFLNHEAKDSLEVFQISSFWIPCSFIDITFITFILSSCMVFFLA